MGGGKECIKEAMVKVRPGDRLELIHSGESRDGSADSGDVLDKAPARSLPAEGVLASLWRAVLHALSG